MLVQFSLMLFPQANRDGLFTVVLRVSGRGHRNYVFTTFKASPEEWDAAKERFTARRTGWRSDNEVLVALLQRARGVLREQLAEDTTAPFDFKVFKARFTGTDQVAQDTPSGWTLAAWLDQIANDLRAESRIKNGHVYAAAANMVQKHGLDAPLNAVTVKWCYDFEHAIRAAGGKNGYLSVLFRTIRAALNAAIKREMIARTHYPFEAFTLGRFKEATAKRAVTLQEISTVEALDLSEWPRLAFARDMFMLSWYLRGMNWVDLVALRPSDLQRGNVVLRRKKTGRRVVVPYRQEAQQIVERWHRPEMGYLLPVLDERVHHTEQQMENRQHKVIGKHVGPALKEVAALAGINPEGFTFYVARHSYATGLLDTGAPVRLIQEAMGHADLKTTEVYLRSFGSAEVAAVDEVLFGKR